MRHGVDYPSCIYDHIHPYIEEEEEKITFSRYITSHMETDHEEMKAPKMTEHYNRNHSRIGQWIMKPP
jgi:hypothetical protein